MNLSTGNDIIRRHPQACYYVLLILATSIAFAGTSALMLAQGRELVWTQDALPLYCNFIAWGCQALQQAVDAAAAGESFALPQYTFNMGYGADVPMTMGSYLQEPINLIALALPRECIGLSYTLMVLARMILAAVTFSWFCFAHGNGRKATGVAALVYATCGFVVLLGAFRHPKFMDWAILLPLILLGADRIFQKKSPVLFVGALVLQFFVSIYFSYMTCIVLLVYCLIKYFAVPRERSVRDFALLVARFLAFGLLAFLICGVFAIPQIIALLSQGRATSGGTAVPLLFTLKYYAKIAAHFIGAAGTTEGMVTNAVSTIGLLAFLLCGKCFDKDRRRAWLIGIVLCLAGVFVPFFGHVMNGMGYSTDRWMLVLSFVTSYILCLALPRLPQLNALDWKRMTWGVVVIAALSAIYGLSQVVLADGPKGTVWPLCLTVAFVAVFLGMKAFAKRGFTTRAALFAGACAIACASLVGIFYCSPLGQNWGTSFPPAGSTFESLETNTPGAAAERIDDAGTWRYTVPRVYDSMKNSPLVHSVMGVDYYTSFYNQVVDDFRQELGISDHHMNFSFVGSDSRLAIEDLTGVKYYICKSRDAWRVPYGFEATGTSFNGYTVFENKSPVPLAFLAPATLSAEQYKTYTMVQKQEALLQAAVVENADESAAIDFASSPIAFEIADQKGLEVDMDGGVIHVRKAHATVTLEFEGLAESETYLSIANLDYREYAPSEKKAMKGKEIGLRDRIADLLWTRATTYPITARSGDRSKASNPATPEHLRYGGKKDWVFNLCYSPEALRTMTVEFDEVGDYTFDSFEVICQPVKPVVANAKTLAANALDNLDLGKDSMSAHVTLASDKPQVAVFTIAYLPGWSVTVDGKPAQALKVDTAFLGVEVSGAGQHEIKWTYETTGVREGLLMTIAGICAFTALILVRRRRHTVQ